MGLETGTYISDLNAANPAGGDGLKDADNHLRLLKSTIKSTFPNINNAVTPTDEELNFVDGVTSSIQTQLDAKQTQIDAKLAASRFPNVSGDVTPTHTELNYVDGVTSAIQTQLDAKAPLDSPALTGNPTAPTASSGDNDTTIATTAFVTDAGTKVTGINTQTGTTYTLVLGDAGKTISMDNASSNTLTIPANASVAFAVGTRIDLVQLGAGQTTVAITSDTLVSRGSKFKINGQYGMASLLKTTTTQWVLVGDLIA